jgi:hypothetical protein
VRVIGELPDGSLAIDGEVVESPDDAKHQAEAFGGDSTEADAHRVPTEADNRRRQTLANPLTPTTPVRGYLPADDAMTVAAEANRYIAGDCTADDR